jgi:hypothetical protein
MKLEPTDGEWALGRAVGHGREACLGGARGVHGVLLSADRTTVWWTTGLDGVLEVEGTRWDGSWKKWLRATGCCTTQPPSPRPSPVRRERESEGMRGVGCDLDSYGTRRAFGLPTLGRVTEVPSPVRLRQDATGGQVRLRPEATGGQVRLRPEATGGQVGRAFARRSGYGPRSRERARVRVSVWEIGSHHPVPGGEAGRVGSRDGARGPEGGARGFPSRLGGLPIGRVDGSRSALRGFPGLRGNGHELDRLPVGPGSHDRSHRVRRPGELRDSRSRGCTGPWVPGDGTCTRPDDGTGERPRGDAPPRWRPGAAPWLDCGRTRGMRIGEAERSCKWEDAGIGCPREALTPALSRPTGEGRGEGGGRRDGLSRQPTTFSGTSRAA